MSRWMTTILFLAGSAILTHWIPFSSFFRNVDTMVHEFGHALATLALSGKVLYIQLYADHSGVTYSYMERGWRMIVVSLAGYTFASGFAVLLFSAYRKAKLHIGFIAMTGLAAVSLVFVNNAFGVLWLIGFIALNVIAMLLPFDWLRQFYYLLVSFICLVESVIAPINLLVLSLADPGQAGDATNLSQATGVPAVLWSLLFVGFALLCARRAIMQFFARRMTRAAPEQAVRWE